MVAVLRRGPSDWWHVGRWRLDQPAYEPGAWFRDALYPQKCDLSPDGRWLAYSALKMSAAWAAGSIYEAVSRLPWLTALAAWEAGTTYTRGVHFDGDAGVCDLGTPDVGDASPCLARYGIKLNPVDQFAVERRRGWRETATTPLRATGGPWDEDRDVAMEKAQPGAPGGPKLVVEGSYAGFRSMPDWHDQPAVYSLEGADDIDLLDGVQWADWDRTGRLLVATRSGTIQVRTVDGGGSDIVWSHDLSGFAPDPQPAPPWASEW